jgi:nuclear control of ATPase protein 2
MATALSVEKLNYSDAQISELTQKIREGDLTPILQVYEDDIKQPIRSAVTGTLIRSLLIQVQKMKVCLEYVMGPGAPLIRFHRLMSTLPFPESISSFVHKS